MVVGDVAVVVREVRNLHFPSGVRILTVCIWIDSKESVGDGGWEGVCVLAEPKVVSK